MLHTFLYNLPFYFLIFIYFKFCLFVWRVFPSVLMVKNPPAGQKPQETWVLSLGWEDRLEEGMATHSRIPAWESHGQRSLVGYSPWGHKRVGHDWSDLLCLSESDFCFSMWDLVPWPGTKTKPPVLGAWSLRHWTTRKVPCYFKYPYFIFILKSTEKGKWSWRTWVIRISRHDSHLFFFF